MKLFKKKLLKMRLMSAVLATVEFANLGVTSYAVDPSDTQSDEAKTKSETKSRVKSAEEMAAMSPEELLIYLEKRSTVEELERYHESGDLDKSRQDVKNFALIGGKKEVFFEYVAKLILENKMRYDKFRNLPIEIETEFFYYALENGYDTKAMLRGLRLQQPLSCNLKFYLSVIPTVKPQVAAKMYGKNHCEKDALITAIASDDMEALKNNVAVEIDFDVNKHHACCRCSLIEYAAAVGNVEAFKYLLMSGAKITEDTKEYALMGENCEIIHIIEQQGGDYSSVLNDRWLLKRLISAGNEEILNWLSIHFRSDLMENTKFNIETCIETDNLSLLVKIFREIPNSELNDLLFVAARCGREVMVKFLISRGADVNATDKQEKTVLMRAVEHGAQKEVVKSLIDNGADVDAADKSGRTVLMYAARNRASKEVLELLIENGASVNAVNAHGTTVLDYAIANEASKEVVEFLIKKGADVKLMDKKGEITLILAIRGCTPISKDVLELLINNGVDVNLVDEDGTTVLMHAAVGRVSKEVIELLIANGADVNATNKKGVTALMHAAAHRVHKRVPELLIANGADVNATDEKGKTALMFAAEKQASNEIIELLIENGADVNAVDEDGTTVLMHAAVSRVSKEVIGPLIANGADVNATNKKGVTALMHAAAHRVHKRVPELLIANGADVNATDEKGKTALMFAAEKQASNEIIELLIENGADVNAVDENGETALMYAAAKESAREIKLLTEKGADVNVVNKDGKTALMFVEGKMFPSKEVIKLLREAGACESVDE